MSEKERITWDQYFLEVVKTISTRSTCNRGKIGCLIVKDDRRIVVTGYAGSPPGFPHCSEAGHQFQEVVQKGGATKQHCIRTVHAEQNAICQAAKYGISLEGGTLYCTMEPCRVCALLIVSVGIKRVVAANRYHAGEETREIFKKAKIDLMVMDKAVKEYCVGEERITPFLDGFT